MRKLKFRAWDRWHNQMEYDLYHEPGDIKVTDINEYFEEETDQYEFMQFTDLQDCNGEDIYEDDICWVEGWGNARVEYVRERGGFVLIIQYGGFRYLTIDEARGSKVVGNIYENNARLYGVR